MQYIIQTENYLKELVSSLWFKVTQSYWPVYSGWISEKIAGYNPYMVLTVCTSFALLFFLVFYWSRSRI